MSNVKGKKVFCAMSGGVDSSVAAALLKEQGYEVVGVHMKCYNVDGCADQDAEDARRAAEVLGIPFYVFDFEKEYKEKVVEYMVDGYRQGITPNPDVMCNKEIKFGLFLKKALAMGADYVATGHYVIKRKARNMKHKNLNVLSFTLHVSRDANKDQSYFLWTLTQKQLQYCLFPIGEYTKPEVRKLAKKFGLPNAEKKDSQGICFLGKVTLKDFLGNYLPKKRGLVFNTFGAIVGEHSGAHFYTIGQRSGLGVGGNSRPVYIAEKDMEENALLVAEENNSVLYRKEVMLKNVNFTSFSLCHIRTNMTYKVLARVRYRQPLVKAKLVTCHMPPVTCKLVFDKPQKFVAAGQSAVFYEYKGSPSISSGLKMLGGGVIVD